MTSTLVEQRRPAQSPELDPSTQSSYRDIVLNKTKILFKIDWHKKILSGVVDYKLSTRKPLNNLVLDTSFLDIHKITFNGDNIKDFTVSSRVEPLGSALNIPISETKTDGNGLRIEFSTTENCTALQWLTPEQTVGKKAPYLFSQCQAIHARSLFPCFDTPSIKSTLDIAIESIYPTVSSGNPSTSVGDDGGFDDFRGFFENSEDSKIYCFKQNIPIPSYLFAIASGDIRSAEIGPRSLVYCEQDKLEKCKYEFEADTETFIQTAEKIVFPYDWKTYNVLVLPPSFPYGGMENPNITFATPTLISGDRQNVDVIAHELAHSWSGNLVTNCSWEHFWLNEGWTVYLERRIIGAIHGEAYRHFSAIIGWKDLENAIETLGDNAEEFTKLVVNLQNQKDPDDAFSTVPYEKGFNFLFNLENLVGGKATFDPFIPYYFTKFKGKSLDSYQFKDTVYEFFSDKKDQLDTVDWDSWYYKSGLPPKPKFDTSIADACYLLATRWIKAAAASSEVDFHNEFSADDIASWTSTQAVVFLDALADGFEKLASIKPAASALDKIYSLSKSNNPEVISRWYRLAIGARLEDQYQGLADWLPTVGRMKFARPGYRQLNSVDKLLAVSTFEKHKLFYHPICRSLIIKDLGL
jgi:leukotriene-A4 hydrolase